MSSYVDQPTPPADTSGWERVAVSSGRSFLVTKTSANAYTYIPERPAVARDAAGQPRVALTLLLARMPALADASIGPLVSGGSLALTCTLSADRNDVRALEAQLDARCTPLFIRDGSAVLRDPARVYTRTNLLGTGSQFWLGTWLPSSQALNALLAFDRITSGLCVEACIAGASPSTLASITLEELFGGVLDGLDRSRYVSMRVLNADGTMTPVPALQREIPQEVVRTREASKPLDVIAIETQLVAVPFAMMPSTAIKPSAASLIASGSTSSATRINAHAQYWLANDGVMAASDSGDDDGLKEHLPIVKDPAAPFWTDALDGSAAWYAPEFAPVMPAANDNPASAPFAFVYARSDTLGQSGVQIGLTATVRITVLQQMSPETRTALAGGGNAQPTPLSNISVSLQIPYRQPGSTTPVTQQFPGTVTQSGSRLVVSVSLLDDWVRLAYSALAFPPGAGGPAQLIITYAFSGYIWKRVARLDDKVEQLPMVSRRDELPKPIERPTIIANELAIVGPRSYIQYRREGAKRARAVGSLATMGVPNSTLFVERSALKPLPFVWRFVEESIVRQETVNLNFPCTSFGLMYLQRGPDGTMTSVGCQDALKLGETQTKAFEEIPALRDPAYRVYRSLQQPGRFLVVPASYRVGRYAQSEGAKAFRPMILMYGVLDADPAKNRYAIAATLIANVSAYQFALLQSALRPYAPSGTDITLVLPSDPFIGAKITYAWTIPSGLDQPQAITVVDVFNVTLSMAMADALLLTTVIDHSGIQGSATFTLPDGMSFNAALVIDGDVIGPPDTGPATAAITAGTITLTNRTQQALNVLDVAVVDASSDAAVLPVNTTLAPGATFSLAAPTGAARAIVDAQLAAHQTIDELDVFVEDVTMTVTFINQINFANHQLTALGVRARLKDSDNVIEVDLPEGKIASGTFTLPITTYLSSQTLQYALIETVATGSTTTPWRDWALNKGTVIGITADLL